MGGLDGSMEEQMKYDGKVFQALVHKVSSAFSMYIRRDLTKTEIKKVVKLNKTAKDAVCHTHDFVDANMEMAEAFQNVCKREVNLDSDADVELWNQAWDWSKKKAFAN